MTATSSDGQSGIATYSFPDLGSGWADSGSGASRTTRWSAANPTTTGGSLTVSATNGAGLVSPASTAFAMVPDAVAPTGGALTVNGVAATAGGSSSYPTTTTVGPDRANRVRRGAVRPHQSGLVSSTLTRRSAPLQNNICGTFGTPPPRSADDDERPLRQLLPVHVLRIDNVGKHGRPQQHSQGRHHRPEHPDAALSPHCVNAYWPARAGDLLPGGSRRSLTLIPMSTGPGDRDREPHLPESSDSGGHGGRDIHLHLSRSQQAPDRHAARNDANLTRRAAPANGVDPTSLRRPAGAADRQQRRGQPNRHVQLPANRRTR